MYFNVYVDVGYEAQGYLIPDGFSAKPRILVRVNDVEYGPIDCDIFNESTFKNKHHETGMVGFHIKPERYPGFGPDSTLEIADADTGFVFYRRFDPRIHIEKRVFRLETQLAPHTELDRSLKPYFQFHADGADQYGSETARQMLEIVNQQSTYVSGRVLYKNVQQYLTPETVKITSLRDPFYELAIRLTTISYYKRKAFPFISSRDEMIFRPAIEHFADLNLLDDKALTERIRDAPKDTLSLFSSPFTKQLVSSSPTDPVDRDSVSRALDILSQFEIFDPEETDTSLADTIAEYLEIDPSQLHFRPVQQSLKDLAERLRSIDILEHVLESDLILHYFIQRAKQKADKA
ncbi:hypothetical protein [Roseibium litorale]|uniref:Uncharacterized protein n=1 Tax=Roseibium litorale TaxID=2803841 RepID=A0ABR9CUP7_9HYPH|nr:hypothetical protein [Roseibium litorale]MBD8894269.1 hypothetical protein [Roseibium litorale]